MFVLCEDHTCQHNSDGVCGMEYISIQCEYGGIDGGKWVVHPTCQNYEVKKDGKGRKPDDD